MWEVQADDGDNCSLNTEVQVVESREDEDNEMRLVLAFDIYL